MRILLQPRWNTAHSLSGTLSLDGAFQCFFLTLPKKDGLPGSAIPPGLYSVRISPSPKFLAVQTPWVQQFAHQIPHILGIPNRSNILIHWGNTVVDTDGCILVGQSHREDFIGASRPAFEMLHARILLACANPQEGCDLQMMDVASNHDNVQSAVAG